MDAGRTECWPVAIGGFVDWMTAANLSPDTIRLRRYTLQQLARCSGADSPWDLNLDELTRLMARPPDVWGAERRKSVRSALRGLYRWGLTTGRIDTDPSANLPNVRVPGARPRPTPESVVADALVRADERTRLMILLAAVEGLRRSEIARAHTEDVTDGGTYLYVHGKGSKERKVPLHPLLGAILLTIPDGYVFPGQIDGHLSPGHVGKLLARALVGRWTGHTLRHRFATVGHAAERDIVAMRDLLGHSRLDTTLIYTGVPDGALIAAVLAAGQVVTDASVESGTVAA